MLKCDRCGAESFLSKELLSIYQTSMVKDLCPFCASQADSYVNYCGVKKDEDISNLKRFLATGSKTESAYYAMMNGGYF